LQNESIKSEIIIALKYVAFKFNVRFITKPHI